MGNRNLRMTCIVIFLIAILTLWGCSFTKDNTQSDEVKPIPVSVTEVELKTIKKTERYIGTTSASKDLNLIPKITGKVQEITVALGEDVKKNQVLVKIDDEEIRKSLRQAELSYQAALSNLINARQGKESQTLQAELQLRQAEESYQQAKDALEQAEELYDKNKISETQLNQVKSTFLQAENGLKLAKDAVEKTKSNQSIKAIEAQLEQAKINVDKARIALDETKIKAPYDGQVAAILAKEGGIASPQMTVLQLVNQKNMVVKLNISESSLQLFKEGKEVSVTIPSMKRTVRGVISFVGPVANNQTLTFPIEIQLDTNTLIKAGLLAEVQVTEIAAKKQLSIPTQAVLLNGQEYYVYLISENRAKKRKIQIIEMGSDITIIKSGLREKEVIVVKGQYELINDSLVEIIKEEGLNHEDR